MKFRSKQVFKGSAWKCDKYCPRYTMLKGYGDKLIVSKKRCKVSEH